MGTPPAKRFPTRSGANVPGRGHHCDRCPTRLETVPGLVLALLGVLFLVPCLTPRAAAGAGEGLEALARSYRELATYRDQGTVEITRFEDAAQTTERLLFTTRLTAGGFKLELWPESGGQTVLWTRAGRLYRYDAAARQFAPATSFAEGLPGSVHRAAQQALMVPRWLLGETAEPSTRPTVDTGQPCADTAGDPGGSPEAGEDGEAEATCRILTFTAPSPESSPQDRLRLWVGETDGLVRRVEVERGPPEPERETPGGAQATEGFAPSRAWVRVQVVHTVEVAREGDAPSPESDGEIAAETPFVPPPEARPVEEIAEAPEGGPLIFSEGIQVFELLIPVRVLGPDGEPVTGLKPEDFVVRVEDSEIPVEAVTWVDPVDPVLREAVEMSEEERRDLGLESFVPGRLVVLFFQADFNAVRIKGHMSFLRDVPELLETFTPHDRVAVVAFDSHLKLWQDFTTDRKAVLDAVGDAYRFGARPGSPREGNVPESLVEHFDFEAAKDAAFVEEGLALVARALEEFNGQRIIVFLGWGVGHNNVKVFRQAHRALLGAGVTLHALDITYADAHTLAFPLAGMAHATGGIYAATHLHPGAAIQTVAVALSGHYELSLDAGRLPAGGGKVQVELREGLRGRIHTPDFEIVAPEPPTDETPS